MSLDELYSNNYVNSQLEKFKNRHTNHWKNRIAWLKKLIADTNVKKGATILDLGCSIGTCAIEICCDGYTAIGLDFDRKALDVAEQLAKEVNCSPTWICQDARNFSLDEPVDVIVCFDLLEHLTDEIINECLRSVHNNLKKGGFFVFHTFPTQYDHIFYQNPWVCTPLIPLSLLPPLLFNKAVYFYSHLLDLLYFVRFGKTHKQLIAKTVHPNPLSPQSLKHFLVKSQFGIVSFELGIEDICPLKEGQGFLAKKFFLNQLASQRSIWGIAQKV